MAKLRPTAISYKNTPEDESLRKWIHSHSNYSGFVKDILRAVMNKECNKKCEINDNSKEDKDSQLIDLSDF